MDKKVSGASNEYFYCYMRNGASFNLRYSIVFKEAIVIDKIKYAVNEALRLYPEFAVKPVIKNNRLLMVPNDQELGFFDEPGDVKYFGTDDTNGYMFYFVCDGKRLTSIMNHGLTDAVGFTTYMKSVLVLYARAIGKEIEDEDFLSTIRLPEHPLLNPDENDLYDPYRLYGNSDAVPEYTFENPGALAVPIEAPFSPDVNHIHEYRIVISTSAFIKLTKQLGASFTPLMIDIAAQAAYRNYDTGDDMFISMLPVNLRPFFGSTTLVNFSDGISIPTYRASEEPDAAIRCARMKDVMKKQMTKAAFEKVIADKAALVDRFLDDESDVRTRPMPKPSGAKPPYSLPISYPGKLTLGDALDDLLEDEFLSGYCRVNSIVAHTFRDKFEYSIIWRSDDDTYARHLCDELRRYGFDPVLKDNGYIKRDIIDLSKLEIR